MPTLRVKLPDQSEATHILRGERVTVGRRPDNTIQIIDRSVSAHHAELLLVDGHYRLHDLESTNLSFVDGVHATDFHLHHSCKVTFGNVECEFDASTEEVEAPEHKLTMVQMEKDVAFLRAENQDLLNKIDGLQRRVDILSSARLITGKPNETVALPKPDQVKKLTAERDEFRFQASGLKLELEKLRDELSMTIRERDSARQANELLQAEHAIMQTDLKSDKGTTQRIFLSSQPASDSTVHLHRDESAPAGDGTFDHARAASK